MYKRFGLTLMVTQDCNLACDYCYIGKKTDCVMSLEMGETAIDRAVRSIEPGGILELGFFGGEPFLVPELIIDLIWHAEIEAKKADIQLAISITTNGTIVNGKTKAIMMMPEVDIVFSIDGRKETHDRHRHFKNGHGSFDLVYANYQILLNENKNIRVVTVVSPSSVANIDQEISALRQMGCKEIELSLDLWSNWDTQAMGELQQATARCAKLWAEGLPEYRLSWFDDKAVSLTEANSPIFRCGFGKGDIAVSPTGNLYPCERLIGDDSPENPMQLAGHVYDGIDFLFGQQTEIRQASECIECGIKDQCDTGCGCCNFTRSGKAGRPDKLLCLFNQWCLQETQNVLNKMIAS